MDNIPLIINGVVGLCVVTVVGAVVVDFLFFQDRNDQKIERKSFVATFTMFCFFFLFLLFFFLASIIPLCCTTVFAYQKEVNSQIANK